MDKGSMGFLPKKTNRLLDYGIIFRLVCPVSVHPAVDFPLTPPPDLFLVRPCAALLAFCQV
jgi:hypothetical protein